MVVVGFDICEPKRLRKVSRELGNFGTRVQKSVFECHLTDAEMEELQRRLALLIVEDEDRIHYYKLCPKDEAAICLDGPGQVLIDFDYLAV